MIIYTIEAGLCWLVFYTIYYAFLRKETFFKYNRIYLIFTLGLGLLLPLSPSFQLFAVDQSTTSVGATLMEPITISAQSFSATLETIVVTANAPETFSFWTILFYLWAIGTGLALLRFMLGLFKLGRLYFSGVRKKMQGYYRVETTKAHLPFSFMQTLFWSNYYLEEDEEKQRILEHELVHIQKRHSLDNIFIALLLIPFWWMPLLYAYQKSLKTIHEYEADAQVTQSVSVSEYGNLLLQYAKTGFQIPLINSFAFTQLKTRILMMTQQKSNPRKKIKYLAILPVVFIMAIFLAHTNPQVTPPLVQSLEQMATDPFDAAKIRATLKKAIYSIKDNLRYGSKAVSKKLYDLKKDYPDHSDEIVIIFKEVFNEFITENNISGAQASDIIKLSNEVNPQLALLNGESIYKVVEVMPSFPGCSDAEIAEQGKQCGMQKMLNFIYTNVKYPETAKANDVEGTVVVRFVVDKYGKITSPKVVRGIGSGCDEEVLRVVNSFPDWNPGTQQNKPVNVYFNLPVKFKLESKTTDDAPAKVEKEKKKVAEQPRISGCEDIENKQERIDCAQHKLLMEVYSNIKYPELARKNGVQGVSILRFEVGLDGKIKNPGFKKYIGGNCEEAIMKVFDHMQQTTTWIPAKDVEGNAVVAEMLLPIKFKLEESDLPENSLTPLLLNEYNLFPNPTGDQVNIAFKPMEKEQIELTVVDVSGKIMITESLGLIEGMHRHQIDVSNWPAGNYFIQLNGNKQTFIDQLKVVR